MTLLVPERHQTAGWHCAGARPGNVLNDCLDSWRVAGFNPVAVNGPKEIENLRQLNSS
jgi:hypothetical protein